MVLGHPLTNTRFDEFPWEKAARGRNLKVFQTLCKYLASPGLGGALALCKGSYRVACSEQKVPQSFFMCLLECIVGQHSSKYYDELQNTWFISTLAPICLKVKKQLENPMILQVIHV